MKRERFMVVARRELLRGLLSDPEWSQRMERARTMEEVSDVLNAYVRAKGLKTVDVDLGEEKELESG